MTDEQRELLLKAQQNLDAAKLLLSNDYPDFSASRAYYAMLYVAEAFLKGEGLSFSKHSAVIAAFGQEFAETRRVSSDFHRFLSLLRQTGQVDLLKITESFWQQRFHVVYSIRYYLPLLSSLENLETPPQ